MANRKQQKPTVYNQEFRETAINFALHRRAWGIAEVTRELESYRNRSCIRLGAVVEKEKR